MRWAESRVAGHGATLHVRRVVDPPAPPILLLHGLGVAGAVWQAFARRLLPQRAAIAPDLRGHGQSDAPPTGYAPLDYATDLAALIDAEPTPVLPVVGQSLGALVALEVARLRPARVAWVGLLDPPLGPDGPSRDVAAVARLRHAPAGELETYLFESNPGGGHLLAELLARLFRQASDAAFDGLLTPAATFTSPRLEQPILLLQADERQGGVLGDHAAEAFVAAQPRATRRKLVGASHALHASHPIEVAQALLAFDDYVSSDSGSDSASSPSR
jgi:pimeloyl-ACP methyl ester carboxylesterase